jgi:hypothetical protein
MVPHWKRGSSGAYSGYDKAAPQFEPEMIKSGRWFVAVKTGNGPDSHIGDFETKADAEVWISTKSKYWPGKPDSSV